MAALGHLGGAGGLCPEVLNPALEEMPLPRFTSPLYWPAGERDILERETLLKRLMLSPVGRVRLCCAGAELCAASAKRRCREGSDGPI